MKIKTKKKLNLPELIQCKRDEGSNHYITIESDNGLFEARLNGSHLMYVAKNNCERDKIFPEMPFDTTFTVEVEEEVTFTTPIDRIIEVTSTNEVMEHHNKSVAAIREEHAPNVLYVPMNGELHFLWRRGMGCLADGVLEVATE